MAKMAKGASSCKMWWRRIPKGEQPITFRPESALEWATAKNAFRRQRAISKGPSQGVKCENSLLVSPICRLTPTFHKIPASKPLVSMRRFFGHHHIGFSLQKPRPILPILNTDIYYNSHFFTLEITLLGKATGKAKGKTHFLGFPSYLNDKKSLWAKYNFVCQ